MRRSGFTLVETMIVVVIIGLLAAIAIPAFLRTRERSTASRIINDFCQFEAAFQRYAMENGQMPPAGAAGVIPAGMAGYLPESFTLPSPMGGSDQWSGPSANGVLRNSNATDAIMLIVDTALDDGNLSPGEFRSVAGVGYGYHLN